MKLDQALDQSLQYEVRKIKNSNREELQKLIDFYNQFGQLKRTITLQKLLQKIGNKGRMWGLYIKGTEELIGSIGIKDLSIGDKDIAEIGYIMVEPEHRSFKTVMMLVKETLRYARRFDDAFITTNIKSKAMNQLLDRTGKAYKILKIKSPFDRSLLYVWNVSTSKSGDNVQVLTDHFRKHILMEL